ncbi:hypothetical protein [Erwinia sp. S38]|uniref:hypothetical protein n=1 Tax=Erwinia sp. S38 TaxID=2769338 RepID=UPI00190C3C94|nr:hypothetical protein [Erwinia sp. S38]
MSASEAMRSLGSTVLNSLVNTFVQMGVEWVKSAMMGSAAQQAGIAATTAASVAGTATSTAASTAAAATTTAAWTPAAIVASIGSFGGAAAIGIGAVLGALAMGIAGKRKNGGPVSAGGLYEFGEGNLPEVLQMGGKSYMLPGNNGRVFSNSDVSGGSPAIRKASTGSAQATEAPRNTSRSTGNGQGASVNVSIALESYGTPQQIVDRQTEKGINGDDVIRIIIQDAQASGPASQALSRKMGMPLKPL